MLKANVAPLMAEQYTPVEDYVQTLDSREKVIIDREGQYLLGVLSPTLTVVVATIQRVMSAFYSTTNIGALVAISSPIAEKVSFFSPPYL